jgi:hypothetical protein
MNHRREAGRFQSAGSNHNHLSETPINMPQQQQPIQQHQSSKSVFVEKRELPRRKKFTRE